MISKKDFMEVWKDTSRENILNQFYHTHKELRLEYEKWNGLEEFIEENLKSLEEKATNKISDNTLAIYGSEMNGFYKVRRKMQELEQGKDE